MFFAASKIFWLFASPVHLCLFALAFGLFRLLRGRGGAGWIALGLLPLAAMALTPLDAALLRPLEDRFPIKNIDMPAPDGIIVLGGAVDERITQARGQVQLDDAAERMTAGAALARAFPRAKLVFSGGSGALFPNGAPEASVAKQLWGDLGVPADRVIYEDKSRNTFENALFTQRLAHPGAGEKWLLVTSAWHMPRAIGCFRALGMNPIAFPVDFRTLGDGGDWRPPGDGAVALRNAELALREWVGLIAYDLTGKTRVLLPGP